MFYKLYTYMNYDIPTSICLCYMIFINIINRARASREMSVCYFGFPVTVRTPYRPLANIILGFERGSLRAGARQNKAGAW